MLSITWDFWFIAVVLPLFLSVQQDDVCCMTLGTACQVSYLSQSPPANWQCQWVVSWECAEVLTCNHISQAGHWLLDSAGMKPWPCWFEAVLSDSGLWMGKGADQTLAGCQPLCPICDIAHTWRQLFLPQPIPPRHWNKQAGQVLCTTDPAQAQNSYVTHRQVRKWTALPGQTKKKKGKNKNFTIVVPFIACHVTQGNHLQHW